MDELTHRAERRFSYGVLVLALLVLLLAVLLGLFYFVAPAVVAGPAQPIAFSHHLHVSIKQIDCRFCHHLVDRSDVPGLPPVEKCMYCHKAIITEHPEIVKLRGYYEGGRPIPWRKVTYLPDHAHFSHQRHMAKKIECSSCHGPVEEMDRLVQVKPFRMGFCLSCHEDKGARIDCASCHY